MIDPISSLSNNSKAAWFWFFTTCALVITNIVTPLFIVQTMKQKDRTIIVDPSKTYYVTTGTSKDAFEKLMDSITTDAVKARLNLHEREFDDPILIDQLYTETAAKQAEKEFRLDKSYYADNNIHQKAEIDEIKILQATTNKVITSTTGQIIQVGEFEGKSFVKKLKFKMDIRFIRNPFIGSNGKLLYLVAAYKLETKVRDDS